MRQTYEAAKARLDVVGQALTDREVAAARLSNYAVALADSHGFKAAMDALEAARGDLMRRRADLAAEAGFIR